MANDWNRTQLILLSLYLLARLYVCVRLHVFVCTVYTYCVYSFLSSSGVLFSSIIILWIFFNDCEHSGSIWQCRGVKLTYLNTFLSVWRVVECTGFLSERYLVHSVGMCLLPIQQILISVGAQPLTNFFSVLLQNSLESKLLLHKVLFVQVDGGLITWSALLDMFVEVFFNWLCVFVCASLH